MKRFFLAWVVAVAIVAVPSVPSHAATDLTQAARAKIEDDLFNRLRPLVGVFDYVAFKVDADGTVTLLGQVREQALKGRVEQEARKADGVKTVRNQVEVLPSSRTDEQLRQSLYKAIYEQTGFPRYKKETIPPIHIVVKNGAVTLEGAVADQKEYAQVNNATKSVSGVASVKNNLTIDKTA